VADQGLNDECSDENNGKNMVVIRDKRLASLYTKNWQDHDLHLGVYVGRGQ
jgi:hypothetical protein